MSCIFNLFFLFCGSSDFSLNFYKNFFNKKNLFFLSSDIAFNYNSFKFYCLKNNFIFFQFKNIFYYNNLKIYNIYHFIKIRKKKIKIVYSFDYGFLFSNFFINSIFYGIYNIHLSFLPILKGCKPLKNSIYNKNLFSSITIIFINKYLDFGKIIFFYKFFNFFFYFFIIFKLKIYFFYFYYYLMLLKYLFFYNFKQINNYHNFLFYKKNNRLSSSVW
ncbi:formyltransferase family protein [Candidatus Nasuia deltocephalinicola]|uniref:formyltransferase family protein n=1 Tax=Candidatus Nasuia deltocephalincola TaxID=1160784 RepID=UPI00216AB70F|nr:formyltransferase family protein [Candidatus Nasuia deltocephalinicola]